MRKNNLWNRLFHKADVILADNQYKIYKHHATKAKGYIEKVKSMDDLESLFLFHKKLWREGFQSLTLKPTLYGMFRCDDILSMQTNQVFLGGIWGLNTGNIPFWESRREELYGENGFGIKEDTSVYAIVVAQYRNALINGISACYYEAQAKIPVYEIRGYKEPLQLQGF